MRVTEQIIGLITYDQCTIYKIIHCLHKVIFRVSLEYIHIFEEYVVTVFICQGPKIDRPFCLFIHHKPTPKISKNNITIHLASQPALWSRSRYRGLWQIRVRVARSSYSTQSE